MICAKNPEDLNILGNYNTQKADNLMVVFELCDPSWSPVPCQS